MGLKQGYEYATGRPVVMSTRGMVASPHYLASEAGLHTLRQGGSAVDASIAINAVLGVVYGHMSGLGGDIFAQVWDPSEGQVQALNGSGRSGENVTVDFYRQKGWDSIEARGPLAANTVPGAVSGWAKMHERYGKLDWAQLFELAIGYARDGFPMSPKYREYIVNYRSTLEQFDATAQLYLPGGRAPKAGALFKQPDLTRALELIASEGPRVFYEGELAQRIVSGLQKAGGLLTEADFAEHTADWVEPLRTTYRGYEVTQLPPNTQGIAALMLLNLLENADFEQIGHGTADYYHLMAEAVKLAFADRDEWVTDPTFLDIPYKDLLSKQRAKDRYSQIDMQTARSEDEIRVGVERQPAGGDTVYLCVVDENGQCCSLIQSVYFEFGSAFMVPGTGILLQNRGSFFSLNEEDPNVLEPRKRSFHTIIPAMALKDGQPALVFGTMGGEGQPQSQAAMLTRFVDYGFNVQEMIEAPRWLYGRTWGDESKALKIEKRIPDGVAAELERRGHQVEYVEGYSQLMGHAQAIWIDREEGILHGGADPRGDGLALGY